MHALTVNFHSKFEMLTNTELRFKITSTFNLDQGIHSFIHELGTMMIIFSVADEK